jgi:ATP-dependent Clp protease ATP-binding subunit ClpA
MFERFTTEARAAVSGAQDEARRMRHPFIGPEHLLIALAAGAGSGAEVLSAHGVTPALLRTRLHVLTGDDLDAEALAALGIDLEQVRLATEANLGPGALAPKRGRMPSGHLSFSRPGKKVLEYSLREAVRLESREIRSGHVLLGLLNEAQAGAPGAPIAGLLPGGVDLDLATLRVETEQLIQKRAA